MPYENGNAGASSMQLPPMGPNKIQQALDDYDRMVADLANVKQQLEQYTDISKSLRAENDVLKDQLASVTSHRDRLNTALQGYLVRYRVIRQTIEAAETEALQEGLAQDKVPEAVNVGATLATIPRNKFSK